jgi:hypothetical protein
MLMIVGCSNTLEPEKEVILTSTYTLPYNQHYDADERFFPVNQIDATGLLREIRFYAYNFGDSVKYDADPTVFFNFFLTENYFDTTYFSPNLSTEKDEKFTVTLNKEFNGIINVHIYRYETFKPIDFRCEILYCEQ